MGAYKQRRTERKPDENIQILEIVKTIAMGITKTQKLNDTIQFIVHLTIEATPSKCRIKLKESSLKVLIKCNIYKKL